MASARKLFHYAINQCNHADGHILIHVAGILNSMPNKQSNNRTDRELSITSGKFINSFAKSLTKLLLD